MESERERENREIIRKWRGNGGDERMRKWRGNVEKMRKSLSIFSLSFHFLNLSPFSHSLSISLSLSISSPASSPFSRRLPAGLPRACCVTLKPGKLWVKKFVHTQSSNPRDQLSHQIGFLSATLFTSMSVTMPTSMSATTMLSLRL